MLVHVSFEGVAAFCFSLISCVIQITLLTFSGGAEDTWRASIKVKKDIYCRLEAAQVEGL